MQHSTSDQFIFPFQIETIEQSNVFIKRLLAFGLSTIVYVRGIFPEIAFQERTFEDIKFKIVRKVSDYADASLLCSWISGAFDAIDKKYLRMLVFAIHQDPDDPESITESYSFEISYSENGTKSNVDYANDAGSPNALPRFQKDAFELLRNIIFVTSQLRPIVSEVHLGMRLFYHDDGEKICTIGFGILVETAAQRIISRVTPADYQPPGFIEASAFDLHFNEDAEVLKIGLAETEFHGFRLKIRKPALSADLYHKKHEISESKNKLIALDEDQSTASAKSPLRCGNINCFCELSTDVGVFIQCNNCCTLVHAACLGYLEVSEPTSCRYCHSCRPDDIKFSACANPELLCENSDSLKAVCQWRLTLLFCHEHEVFTLAELCEFFSGNTTIVKPLFKRLRARHIVERLHTGRGSKSFQVLRDNFALECAKYFTPAFDIADVSSCEINSAYEQVVPSSCQQRIDPAIDIYDFTSLNERVDIPAIKRMCNRSLDSKKENVVPDSHVLKPHGKRRSLQKKAACKQSTTKMNANKFFFRS